MEKYVAVTAIDHNGKITPEGTEVSKSTFGEDAWKALLDAGSVAEVKPSATEEKTDAENEALKARVAELEAALAAEAAKTPPSSDKVVDKK